mgnify:CR=1 FL=1
MLRSLDIRDLLIIDHLQLEFQPGLTVLTGETGAGKSILLDSLGFVLGWRGRAELVRKGAKQGEVLAVFDLDENHPARRVLAEAGLPVGDELILRRVNASDGRKTAWVNDRRVSGEVLRQLSELLVELHGQQDDRGLLDVRAHRRLLDDFGGLGRDVDAVRKAWRDVHAARKALKDAQTSLDAVRQEEDFLRHAVAELDGLDPQPGEEGTLDEKRRLMQAAERIGDDIAKALVALGSDGAEGNLADALRWLEDVAGKAEGQLDEPLAAIARAANELAIAEQGVQSAVAAMSFDAGDLEQAEERLFAIRALARKHDVAADDLGEFGAALRAKLAALDAGEADMNALQARLSSAEQTYDKIATALSSKRQKAATKLDKAMAGELTPLKMENAGFVTEIAAGEPGSEGRDAVSFTVSTNPGAPAGPINKIASGGELSRFLLALKVCLTRGSAGLTLIFDEIDRGVGGATADAVGRRLSGIADGAQVLVVTHSPQVAARGQHHWRVSKSVVGGMTTSKVVGLAPHERVDELARMLAGDTITDHARDAARALLAG